MMKMMDRKQEHYIHISTTTIYTVVARFDDKCITPWLRILAAPGSSVPAASAYKPCHEGSPRWKVGESRVGSAINVYSPKTRLERK